MDPTKPSPTDQSAPKITVNAAPSESETPNKLSNQDPWRWFKANKRWIVLGSVAAVILAAGGTLAYLKLHHGTKPVAAQPAPKPAAPAPPPPATSPLTGVNLTAAQANDPIFGTVIENSPEARPQSGLGQAGVVYEALAEGGITRFLAMFEENQPTSLGPVRSLRPYFIDWASEYNQPPVAHAGGSQLALQIVNQIGFKSMNGLNFGRYFHRTGDRAAPHNLYTSTGDLLNLMKANGWTTPANFKGWPRKPDSPEGTPSHPNITLNFSFPLFSSNYKFNASCDCYDRFLAGAPHKDRNSGAQIQVKNVVAITVQTGYDNVGHALMTTIGSGRAVVFRDGGAVVGTWKKDSRNDRIQFLDASGQSITLNVGTTWIGVIPQTGSVVY